MNNFLSLVLIVLSALLGFFVIKPKMAEINDLSLKKGQYEEALASLRSIEELKQNLERQLDALSPEARDKMMVLLPTSSNTVKLISDIDAIVARHGTSLKEVSYTQTKDNSQSLAEASTQNTYKSTTVSFSFVSDYNKFKSILSEIETSLRIVDVRTVSINANKDGNTYKVEAEIYWLP